MEVDVMHIRTEIGFYDNGERYYVNLKKNKSEYDPIFGDLLLFSGHAITVLTHFTRSIHLRVLGRFLLELTPETLVAIARGKEKKWTLKANPEKPCEKSFFIDVSYTVEEHAFCLEGSGFSESDSTIDFFAVTSVMVILSYLAKLKHYDPGYCRLLTDIANHIGELYESGELEDERESIEELAFRLSFTHYDDYLNIVEIH